MLDLYHAFTRFTRWYLRFVTSAVAGLFAATALCLGGSRLLGSGDDVMSVLFVLAIPLWIIVSVISYKALKPGPENRE